MKIFLLALAISLTGCGSSGHPGNRSGAKALLSEALLPNTDRQALTQKLRPTKKDFYAVFKSAADAETAYKVYKPFWDSGKITMRIKPGQSQLLLWEASTDDLVSGLNNAKYFPGGYKRIASRLKPGLKVYRWKFVKPGKKSGMASDGLYHLNGHWFWIPKPWRALR